MNLAEKQKNKELRCQKKSHKAYQGRFISVREDTYLFENEAPFTSDVVLHPGATVILPIQEDGKLLLIKQWRRTIQEILIEAPAGMLDPGEPIIECAMRELREETGYSAKKLTPMGKIWTAPGFCNEVLHLFLAEGLSKSPLPKDAHEAIDLFPVKLEDAIEMIESGEITDAKTTVLILRYSLQKAMR